MTPKLKRTILFIAVFILFVVLIFGIGRLEKGHTGMAVPQEITNCQSDSIYA